MHGGYLNHGLFHRQVAERLPLLHDIEPTNGGQRIGRPDSSFVAHIGIVRIDQVDERLPGHNEVHLNEKRLPFSLFLGHSELVIRELKLLVIHQTHPGLLISRKILPRLAEVI